MSPLNASTDNTSKPSERMFLLLCLVDTVHDASSGVSVGTDEGLPGRGIPTFYAGAQAHTGGWKPGDLDWEFLALAYHMVPEGPYTTRYYFFPYTTNSHLHLRPETVWSRVFGPSCGYWPIRLGESGLWVPDNGDSHAIIELYGTRVAWDTRIKELQ